MAIQKMNESREGEIVLEVHEERIKKGTLFIIVFFYLYSMFLKMWMKP